MATETPPEINIAMLSITEEEGNQTFRYEDSLWNAEENMFFTAEQKFSLMISLGKTDDYVWNE